MSVFEFYFLILIQRQFKLNESWITTLELCSKKNFFYFLSSMICILLAPSVDFHF